MSSLKKKLSVSKGKKVVFFFSGGTEDTGQENKLMQKAIEH